MADAEDHDDTLADSASPPTMTDSASSSLNVEDSAAVVVVSGKDVDAIDDADAVELFYTIRVCVITAVVAAAGMLLFTLQFVAGEAAALLLFAAAKIALRRANGTRSGLRHAAPFCSCCNAQSKEQLQNVKTLVLFALGLTVINFAITVWWAAKGAPTMWQRVFGALAAVSSAAALGSGGYLLVLWQGLIRVYEKHHKEAPDAATAAVLAEMRGVHPLDGSTRAPRHEHSDEEGDDAGEDAPTPRNGGRGRRGTATAVRLGLPKASPTASLKSPRGGLGASTSGDNPFVKGAGGGASSLRSPRHGADGVSPGPAGVRRGIVGPGSVRR